MQALTWDELKTIEPNLVWLEELATRETHKDYDVLPRWYEFFKPAMTEIVGEDARSSDPRVRSHQAYDVAYKHLLNTLNTGSIQTPYDSRAEELAACGDEGWV